MYFWTSWEKLDIDVPVYASDSDGKRLDKPGSYIIPAVIQGRLTLFIPEITLGQSSKNDFVLSGKKTGQELLKEKLSLSSDRWWEIRMGRTERRNGKWIAKTVSPEVFREMPTGEEKVPSIDGFRFWLRVRESDDGKEIRYLDVEHQDTTHRTAIPSTRTGYIPGCKECLTRHTWSHTHVAYYGSIESHGHQVICSVLPEHSEIFDTLSGDEMRFHIITRAERGPFGGKNMLAPFYAIKIDGEKIPEESFRRWPISLDEAHNSSQIGPKALVFDNVTANHGYLQYIGIPYWESSWDVNYYLYNFMNLAIAGLVDCIHNGGEIDAVHTYFENVGSNGTVARDTFGWLEYEYESFFHERVRPFAIYNWELGVHIPLMMAERLMVMQQYDLALETLRTVFDPAISSDDPIQCWRFPPFLTVAAKLRNDVRYPSRLESNAMERTLKELLASGNNNVHVYARNYPQIYMKRIMLKYIEILINMGDVFFRQATLESIPLAIERYIQASHIFGPRPVIIPNLIEPEAKTYQGLRWSETDFQQSSFNMALEILPCGDMAVLNAHKLKPQGFFKSEYFSIPANPYIIELRNRIDQRLHNIRNGLDINGNPMSLELFELPIDPSQVLAGQVLRSIGSSAKLFSSQGGPIPRYRFRYLIRQAYELVNELRLASQQLIQIKEKKDAEAIWLLRVKHKRTLLEITKRIKTNQKLEVEKGIEVLQETRKQLEMRLNYHLQLTGDSPTIPTAEGEAWTDVIQSIAPPTTDDLRMSPFELDEMNFAEKASDLHIEAGWLDASAAAAFAIPNFSIKAQPMGMGMDTSFGGYILGQLILAKAAVVRLDAQEATDYAVRAARTGAIVKQFQERRLEINGTGREIVKSDRKIKQLRVRLAVCDADIKAHQQEVENAAAEEEWLRTKYTSKELYTFLDNSMSVIFKQTYTIAADMAALARRSLNFEHATRFDNDSKLPNIVNYWNNSHDGHLAAEAMYLDLKQLEKLYMENRAHDFEIKKSISLRRLSPIELLKLRETGEAILDIPEALFDMDYPGHFCRRISSVSVSIPCILGAYTSLSCTLRLTKHGYRISPDLEKPEEEALREDVIPITSIAVSNGVQDSGTFNLDFRGTDEYGPFEGAGAISTWKIELPNTFRPFDYHTISDVVLHLQYTSINGGEELKTAASQAAESFISESGTSALAIDLKHDYSSEWRNLASTGQLHLKNVVNRMPFWTHGQDRPVKVNTITLYLYPRKPASATVRVGESVILLESATADALSQYALVKTDINEPLADQWMIEDLPKEEVYERGWLVIGYSAGQSA